MRVLVALNVAMCQGFGGVNTALGNGFGSLNLTVAEQAAQNRLQAQELASQQQACCCQVLRAIETEGCQNRELQRERSRLKTLEISWPPLRLKMPP